VLCTLAKLLSWSHPKFCETSELFELTKTKICARIVKLNEVILKWEQQAAQGALPGTVSSCLLVAICDTLTRVARFYPSTLCTVARLAQRAMDLTASLRHVAEQRKQISAYAKGPHLPVTPALTFTSTLGVDDSSEKLFAQFFKQNPAPPGFAWQPLVNPVVLFMKPVWYPLYRFLAWQRGSKQDRNRNRRQDQNKNHSLSQQVPRGQRVQRVQRWTHVRTEESKVEEILECKETSSASPAKDEEHEKQKEQSTKVTQEPLVQLSQPVAKPQRSWVNVVTASSPAASDIPKLPKLPAVIRQPHTRQAGQVRQPLVVSPSMIHIEKSTRAVKKRVNVERPTRRGRERIVRESSEGWTTEPRQTKSQPQRQPKAPTNIPKVSIVLQRTQAAQPAQGSRSAKKVNKKPPSSAKLNSTHETPEADPELDDFINELKQQDKHEEAKDAEELARPPVCHYYDEFFTEFLAASCLRSSTTTCDQQRDQRRDQRRQSLREQSLRVFTLRRHSAAATWPGTRTATYTYCSELNELDPSMAPVFAYAAFFKLILYSTWHQQQASQDLNYHVEWGMWCLKEAKEQVLLLKQLIDASLFARSHLVQQIFAALCLDLVSSEISWMFDLCVKCDASCGVHPCAVGVYNAAILEAASVSPTYVNYFGGIVDTDTILGLGLGFNFTDQVAFETKKNEKPNILFSFFFGLQ
jgi:hypothetical protein